MLDPRLPRSFHEHQYVKVAISPTKTEIGIVVQVNDDQAIVATRHGYNITVKLEQMQRAFLLVLDLNGVLGVRHAAQRRFDKRPHLEKFIKYALSNFVVAVWTSCEERNGTQIINDLFEDDRDRLLFTLYRTHCTPNPTIDKPYGTRKDLQRIFSKWPESFHAVNTIIIDDSADKCSHPDLALCPTQFSGAEENDTGLLSIMETLDKILKEDSLAPLIEIAHQRQEELATKPPSPPPPPVTVLSCVSELRLADGNAPVVRCDVTSKANETVMKRLQELMAQIPQDSPSRSSHVQPPPPPPPAPLQFAPENKHNDNHHKRRRHNNRKDDRTGDTSVVSILQNARRVQQS